ncbi:UDP-N-acetylmuramate--L-alanine ligase [Paenibacillus sp. Z6-24]
MNKTEHIHFIGIGGYGMSAIAKVLLEMGYKVTGSDVAMSALAAKLQQQGAEIHIGHDAQKVHGADLLVYSSAVATDDVELVEARRLEIPVLHRSEMLARLLNERKGVAVAGAHGKTTTSSMIALVMEECDADPTYIIGGEIVNLGTNAKAGKGDYVVAEADESDGTFLQYHPTIAVVTNIEADHLENYDGDFANIKAAYVQFLSQLRPGGKAIVNADDENVRELLPNIKGDTVTFGIQQDADYTAEDIQPDDRKISFVMKYRGEKLGTVQLSVPGIHNVYNAMATIISCLEAGLSFTAVAAAIVRFQGAKRRFQVIGEANNVLVVDDYAHHPTEIEATLQAARATGKKIIAIFQPQRYSRTFFLLDEFSRAFTEADEVIITDIYAPAGEQQIEGVHSSRLVELICENSNSNARYIAEKEEVVTMLTSRLEPGTLIITMGAGDIWKVSKALAEQLESTPETN